MDTYRGSISHTDAGFGALDHGLGDDETGREPPPSFVGQDERRMQVRAYNYWAGLLDNRSFPSIEELDPKALPDFGPFSVLLDFTGGIENPAIQFVGDQLAGECGAEHAIRHLSDVPSKSLLSRITDHYMQILANQAPIGFEAEFVNQRGCTTLYRGILLPFSSDDDAIDFIYGVINWKELADQQTTDELLLEIDQALNGDAAGKPHRADQAMAEWADGPADLRSHADSVLDLGSAALFDDHGSRDDGLLWPSPAFGASPAAPGTPPYTEMLLAEPAPEDMGLADWLASARELAQAAQGSEDRTRSALYDAIGRAYDFSLAASEAPDDFDELLVESGLTVQDRAPMTPVVKLVFGAEYDKTRLTEYASALSHAHRIGLPRGQLSSFLSSAPGGLKGVVNTERRLKREESGRIDARETPRELLARKLRKLDHMPLGELSGEGSEFTLLVARRLPTGEVVLLGEIGDDVPLLERAARRLLG